MTPAEFEAAVGRPLVAFRFQCHAASLALVRSASSPDGARVARGSCPGVLGQHSWVVLGGDCYDERAQVIDATLWSYDDAVREIWTGRADERPHTPHGAGSIFQWGKPEGKGGPPIELDADLSTQARDFLAMLGPLDRKGWAQLAHAPVGLWPAAEIIGAMYDDARLGALVPIDIVGMVTDRNPGGLYCPVRTPDGPEHRP